MPEFPFILCHYCGVSVSLFEPSADLYQTLSFFLSIVNSVIWQRDCLDSSGPCGVNMGDSILLPALCAAISVHRGMHIGSLLDLFSGNAITLKVGRKDIHAFVLDQHRF